MASSPSTRTKVFISYSHEDQEWLERLKLHLKPLVREGSLDYWDDTHIRPGDDWQQEIRTALDRAQVAVLLISADFFASDFINENELPPLLDAAQAKGVRVLPVILSASRFARDPSLTRFQSVNSPAWPLDKMPPAEQEKVFDRLAQTIESALNPRAMGLRKRDKIDFSIAVGDALSQECDVLVLKYAQATYGLDRLVVEKLEANGIAITDRLPEPSSHLFVNSRGTIAAKYVHFVGVDSLKRFSYKQIREFSNMALRSLATELPGAQQVVLTLHGANYGLDEVEAFNSEVAGIVDAITSGKYPLDLAAVTIVERNPRRAEILNSILERLLPKRVIPVAGIAELTRSDQPTTNNLRTVGYDSASKPHVFVAMPFVEDMDDVYHYGIQGAVNAAGFLCERADSSSFTGEVMSWVKQRIETCSLIIADLSRANPNVYLEVGYAWGRDRPTILLVNDSNDLTFDVKGHRCLVYKNIRKLEESLRTELLNLRRTVFDGLSQTS